MVDTAIDTAQCPFIDLVPKDVKQNLRWRIAARERALVDLEFRHALYDAAMMDVLFFFNVFLWVFEPRAAVTDKPFITWPHQDPVILAMDQAITDALVSEEPLAFTVKKSRAQGGTYAYLGVDLRRAIRDAKFSVGLVTRNEKLVDSATDSDTVMYKVAWLMDHLPFWMLPCGYERSLTEHTIVLPHNGSLFTGYSATGDVARGGRKTKFDCDEIGSEEFIAAGKDYKVMSSVSSVSNCTFLISTFGADSGVFYEAATDPDNPRLYTLDWKDNPTQNKNAYVIQAGKPVAVRQEDQPAVSEYAKKHDKRLKKLERLGHAMEGKFRSPWYDAYCLLPGATPRFVARELDMDPRGTVGKVFASSVLDSMKDTCCKRPIWQGRLVVSYERAEVTGLIPQENGPLKLWFLPGVDRAPPTSRYALGCDISAGGTGDYSSNSVACGVDRQTGQQVVEYAIMGLMAPKFARVCVALSKWLKNAYLSWEASGPTGAAFGKEVLEVLYYSNVYYREVKEIGQKAKSKSPGWWNGSDEDKGQLFEALCIAMEDGKFVPRSEDMIRECGEYEWDKGKIVHKPSKQHGITERAHGDRCVAAGVAWLACEDRPVGAIDNESEESHITPPYGSFAWREQRENEERRRWTDDEPLRTIHDVLRN